MQPFSICVPSVGQCASSDRKGGRGEYLVRMQICQSVASYVELLGRSTLPTCLLRIFSESETNKNKPGIRRHQIVIINSSEYIEPDRTSSLADVNRKPGTAVVPLKSLQYKFIQINWAALFIVGWEETETKSSCHPTTVFQRLIELRAIDSKVANG